MMILLKKNKPQNDDPFSPDLSLINNSSISESYTDSRNKNSQLQTIPETYPSVSKQSLNNSFLDPSFSKYTSKKRIVITSW